MDFNASVRPTSARSVSRFAALLAAILLTFPPLAEASGGATLRLAELLATREGRFLLVETREGERMTRALLGRGLRDAGEIHLLTSAAVRRPSFAAKLEERLEGLMEEFRRVRGEPQPRSFRSRYGLSAMEESLLRRLSQERMRFRTAVGDPHRFFEPPIALPGSLQGAHQALIEAGSEASSRLHSPLVDGFLKLPGGQATDALADLARFEDIIPGPLTLPTLGWQPSRAERLAAAAAFPLERAVIAPGHRYLGKAGNLQALKNHIVSTGGGYFQNEPIVLNLIVDDAGRIGSVDIWDAHHRLLAYLEAGYKRVGDIPEHNLRILVNGTTDAGEAWRHFVPAAGVHTEALRGLPYAGGMPGGTLAISGRVSNYAMGSRTTLGKLRRTMRSHVPPKVGVYFGTFDPIHESHIRAIRRFKEAHGLDEVILVPQVEAAGAAPAQDRIAMLAARLRGERGVNLLTEDSSAILSNFGEEALMQRIGQLYGTHDLHRLQSSVEVRLVADEIRAALQGGASPAAGRLHPDVADYIRARGLYR